MPIKVKSKSKVKTHSQISRQLPSALVAGAAGFIGSHLCETLLSQNCQVYAIDNWTTAKKKNLEALMDNDHFIFIEHNLEKSFDAPVPKVDYIFHLAGVEAYVNGLDVSLETLLVNSLGTKELLEIAKDQGAKFLLASTADIYSGHLASIQKDETYSHYEAKRFSEAITFEYLDRYHLNSRVVRLGLVYGPRMDLSSGNDMAQLLQAAANNQPLKIYGQGLTTLYPTHINDVVYGLTKAMFSQSSSGHIYTLIDPEKITLLNLAYKLKQLLPEKNLKVEFVPDSDSETNLALESTALSSQTELGWSPKVTLDQGILSTLNWLKNGKVPTKTKPEPEATVPEPIYTPEELGIQPAKAPEISLPVASQPKLKLLKFKLNLPKFPKFSLPKPKLSLRPRKPQLTKKTKLILLSAGLLFLYLLAPIVLLVFSSLAGVKQLKSLSRQIDFSQVDQLTKTTAKAQKNFTLSRELLRRSQFILSVFGLKSFSQNLDQLLFIANKLSQGAGYLFSAGQSGTVLSQIVFHNQEGNLSQALKETRLSLDQAYTNLSFVDSELQSGRERQLDLTVSLTKQLQNLTDNLPQIRHKINQARTLLPLIPGFIAQDTKKTYLVLFQNSAELRPTGGFIGSYGLLTFEKGKLLDFNVQDIYEADGQLKGFVEPPKPITQFFGKNTWYFRDSNWDPDFTISAARAEWFLGKTTNRNVDGVIAINLPAVKELLAATGPITLSDYNEEVSSDNIFERAEYHSEIDFFPGSTQKKDFLGALAREMFDRLQKSSASDLLKLAQALETSLSQKQILLYLHDTDSQRLLLEQNWAGALYAPRLAAADNRPVTSDYSYLVEANLGINKANYFLKREIEQQLTLLKNREILSVTTINYQNQSPADAWPGGVYRSYLRHYIPSNSIPISVKVGDTKLDLKSVDQTIINDKLILGFPITVPVKNSLSVEITYRLNQALSLTDRQGRLAVVIPKQPGTIADLLKVIVNYPSYLSVVAVSSQGIVSPQVVTLQTDLSQDRLFTIDFVER
ncbi:MAG: DUF4012 domain-containing protein [Candidatus Beckwithbacteria bacterium]